MQIETELLPCKLDPVERKEKGEELSRMILKHKRLEEEKKAAAKEWKERLDDHAEKILALSHEVKTGKADRLVEIEERAAPSKGCVHVVRLDTGQAIRARAMTPAEKNDLDQASLFAHQGGKRSKAKG